MFGFGNGAALKRAHDDIEELSGVLYGHHREFEDLERRLKNEEERANRLAGKLLVANNELASLKDKRAKSNANLAAANARRKLAAAEREAV